MVILEVKGVGDGLHRQDGSRVWLWPVRIG